MITLNIHHRTGYRYRQPVRLGPHRLMLCPRESRDLRLNSSDVTLTPPAAVTWAQDVTGNAVATAIFQTMTDTLVIESHAEIQRHSTAWPVFDIAASAVSYPFYYSEDERIDLGALAVPQYRDAAGELRDWARAFVRSNPTDTLALLKDLSAGVSGRISYQDREDEGTSRRRRRSIAVGGPAAISRSSSSRRRAAWVSERGLSPAISTIRIGTVWAPAVPGRPMRGPKSMCRAPAGSTPRTAASAASI